MITGITTQTTASKFDSMRSYWNQLKPREKRLFLLTMLIFGSMLLWWLALSPAIKTIRSAPQQQAAMDAQIQKMMAMQQDAKVMQSQPKMNFDDAKKALQDLVVQRLNNSGQLSITGNRAVLTLKNTNAQALADLFTQARVNARAVPLEAKIGRNPQTAGGWDGTITFNLPNQ